MSEPLPTPAEISEREAWVRARLVLENLELKKTISLLRAEASGLRQSLENRDTTIHNLHLEIMGLRDRYKEVQDDLECFVNWLASAEARIEGLSNKEGSLWWKFSGWLPPLFSSPKPLKTGNAEAAEPIHAIYYLYTSPYRVYRAEKFEIRGWVLPAGGDESEPVRGVLGSSVYEAESGLLNPEVVSKYRLPDTIRPGFSLVIQVPLGKHMLSLEVLRDGKWRSFLRTPIWTTR